MFTLDDTVPRDEEYMTEIVDKLLAEMMTKTAARVVVRSRRGVPRQNRYVTPT